MKTVGSGRSNGGGLAAALLFTALALIGGGLGWWLHPGVGLSSAGLLLWIDLLLWSRGA